MSVQWPGGVNTRVLRSGSNWKIGNGAISDKTKSGKIKQRGAHSLARDSFTVTMRFNQNEYAVFKSWFIETLRRGAVSFMFPQIDAKTNESKEYSFVAGQDIAVDNPSAQIINVSMQWYEV